MSTRQPPETPVHQALSEHNPRITAAVKLQRAARRRAAGLFLAEGANAVAAALDADAVVELFYSSVAARRDHELVAGAAAQGVRTTLVGDRAAALLGQTVTPPGLVAVCRQVDVPLTAVLAGDTTLLVIAVDLADPGNAGTLIRIADAMAADAVVFAGDSVDPHNGKCVRAGAGSLFHLPVVRERDPAGVMAAVRAAGSTVVATSADGELDLDDAEQIMRQPVAWLFGNEAHGLSPQLAGAADYRVRIPIYGHAESLNLAAAAAICLYASARVRYQ